MFLTQFTAKDNRRNLEVYKEYSTLKMVDGWHPGDKDDVYPRLFKIAKFTKFPLKDSTCLDVGCGTGDLSFFLKSRGVKSYVGVDILKSAISEAKHKYPNEGFFVQDILEKPLSKKFDFVFSSGALSVKLSVDNYVFMHSMIRNMWKAASKGLVFNFWSDEDDDPDPDLFFYNIDKVKLICKKVAPKAKLFVLKNRDKAQVHFYLVR